MWTKGIQQDLKSLELDFMRDGMDIYESEKTYERLGKIKDMFETSRLASQLKDLKDLKSKMSLSISEVFKSME